jgi:hypothetical protein
MKVLVCGSRDWKDAVAIRKELLRLLEDYGEDLEVIHGDCRGADRIADRIARGLGIPVTPFPAEWKRLGKRAGPLRNQRMLDTKPDLVVAFALRTGPSRGTGDMLERARKAGVKIRYIEGNDRRIMHPRDVIW